MKLVIYLKYTLGSKENFLSEENFEVRFICNFPSFFGET